MTVKQATKTRRTLIGAVRSELKRLRRPSVTVAGLGLIALFTLVGTFVVFNSGEGILTASMPPGMGIPTDVSSARGLVAGVPMSADLIGIVVLSLWAAAAGSDYATGWIRVMVQAEPRRWRLLAGKGFALAIFTVVATLVATSVAVALAPPLASMMSVSTELWYEGTVSLFVESWLNLTIAVLVWGMIGFAIATVSRSAVVAIAGGSDISWRSKACWDWLRSPQPPTCQVPYSRPSWQAAPTTFRMVLH